MQEVCARLILANFNNEKALEARWGNHGVDWPDEHRQCLTCGEIKHNNHFHKNKNCKGGINSICKECRKPLSRNNYKEQSLPYKLWYRARHRAKTRNILFTIEISDITIPEVCPVFHYPFEENTVYAASLDRINSELGYTKDNVRVISSRANMLKNDATIEELELILEDLKQLRC